jgi:hypothetical protein
MRDPGWHWPDRALADRYQAGTHAAGGELADRDHDRGNGHIRADVDPYRDPAICCRTAVVGRRKGPVAKASCAITLGVYLRDNIRKGDGLIPSPFSIYLTINISLDDVGSFFVREPVLAWIESRKHSIKAA